MAVDLKAQETSEIGIGDAPCGNCKTQINGIPVIKSSIESDGDGGHWFKVQNDTVCPVCEEPLNVYHLPPK